MLHFSYLAARMKSRSFIFRCAAFLLILVFSQKAGAGLFLHNLLHSPSAYNKGPQRENEKGKDFSYNCTCIDDFLMPFNDEEKPVLFSPGLNFTIPVTFYKELIPFRSSIFSSLRGPPTILL